MKKELVVIFDEAGQVDKVRLLVNGEFVVAYEPEDLESAASDLLMIEDEDVAEFDPEDVEEFETADLDAVETMFSGDVIVTPRRDEVVGKFNATIAPDGWLDEEV